MAPLCSKKMRFLFILFFLFSDLKAQTQIIRKEYPKIGDTVPTFMLSDLHYYTKTKASSAEFKGKPMILDFFSAGCSACFATFSKLNELKKEFAGKVQFMLVGYKTPGIEKQYDKYRRHYHLDLPVDFDESTIKNQFGVASMPYTLWIDSSGTIRQITTSFALSSARINNLLAGKPQSLSIPINQEYVDHVDSGKLYYNNFFDSDKPLLIDGNGGADSAFLYRSMLCVWDNRSYVFADLFIGSKNGNRVQEIGSDVNWLFTLAYGDTVDFLKTRMRYEDEKLLNHYGQWALTPVNESSQTDLFHSDADYIKNLFSYSLIIPVANASALKLQRIMQRDLKNYFSLEAKVEIRKMPCWRIIALKGSEKMLRTKGGDPQWAGDFSGFRFINQPMHSLLLEIWSFHQRDGVFLDDTGIDYNIDIKFDAILTDISDIKRELQKHDLDLVRGEKEMKVIVIRDVHD
jgi:thiol-disulfide isomerase/thioredoxin